MLTPILIRPSLRRAKLSFAICLIFLGLVIWLWLKLVPDAAWWITLVGVLPFIAPVLAWLDSLRSELKVENGVVRYRHGLLNHTTRAMDLRKLQDVRVHRTLSQRMWGTGTLVLETAGETGMISIADIDSPQKYADVILEASRETKPPEGTSSTHV